MGSASLLDTAAGYEVWLHDEGVPLLSRRRAIKIAAALVRQLRKRHGTDDVVHLTRRLVEEAYQAERARIIRTWLETSEELPAPAMFFGHAALLRHYLADQGLATPPDGPAQPAWALPITEQRVATYVVDRRERICYVDGYSARVLGYRRRDLVGADPLHDLVAPWDRTRAQEHVDRVRSGEVSGNLVCGARTAAGWHVPVLIVRGELIFDDDDRPLGRMGCAREAVPGLRRTPREPRTASRSGQVRD